MGMILDFLYTVCKLVVLDNASGMIIVSIPMGAFQMNLLKAFFLCVSSNASYKKYHEGSAKAFNSL